MSDHASPPAALLPDLALTFGVLEISILIVMFLTGAATLQIWNYFRDYEEDPLLIKSMVCLVYLGDVLHTALLIHALYTYTIIWFGQYLELQTIVWSLEGTLPLAGVIAFVVQTYFCLRIQRVTQTWTFATGCWILALVRMILCFVLTAEVVAVGVFTILQAPKSQALGLATLCIGAVSDVLVAGFICKGLLGVRSGLRTTDKLLDKLVAYTIGSGLLTSIVAVCEAVTFGVLTNFVFLAFYGILPKLFSNSLLASLNERRYTRREVAKMNHGFRSSQSRSSEQRVTLERSTAPARVEVELGPVGTDDATYAAGAEHKGHEFNEV